MQEIIKGEQKYSVLMSIYAKDNPQYLVEAIDSMLTQTIPPEQFVLVIDGTVPEEIRDIVKDYLNKYKSTFTVVALEHNGGLGNALNEGLKYCRNELVARMDADDISLPQRCEKELELFKKNERLDICGCNIDEFMGTSDNIRTSRVVPQDYQSIQKFMRKRQPFNHPTVMYKRSKVLKIGGYPNLRRKEDFDLFSRMLKSGCYALNINESLYLYRIDEDNYKRRKSWVNTKSAISVYTLHYKRKGCSFVDWLIICNAELLFWIAPYNIMKNLSDRLLRKKVS